MSTIDEAEIRKQRELWKDAFEAGDVERIMSSMPQKRKFARSTFCRHSSSTAGTNTRANGYGF